MLLRAGPKKQKKKKKKTYSLNKSGSATLNPTRHLELSNEKTAGKLGGLTGWGEAKVSLSSSSSYGGRKKEFNKKKTGGEEPVIKRGRRRISTWATPVAVEEVPERGKGRERAGRGGGRSFNPSGTLMTYQKTGGECQHLERPATLKKRAAPGRARKENGKRVKNGKKRNTKCQGVLPDSHFWGPGIGRKKKQPHTWENENRNVD